jgi:phage-related protein
MADTPVIVPVQLEVTELDMGNVNISDVQKSMTQKLAGLSKSINSAMSAIGKSGQANKAIGSSMSAVEKSVTRVFSAYDKFSNTLKTAGKSSDEYKAKLQELEQVEKELNGAGGLADQKSQFENASGDFIGTENMWEDYIAACERYETALNRIWDLQQELSNPAQFAGSGSTESVDKVKAAYQALMQAIADSNSKVDSFNNTLANNQYTDAYANKLKELEAAQKRITALSEKSQKMSMTGASEGAWKNLQADADLLNQKIVQIQAELTQMVQEGQAFRFGGDSATEIDAINQRVQQLLNLLGQVKTTGKPTTESVIKGFKKVDKTLTKIGKSIGSVISKMFKLKKSGTSTTNSLQKGFKKLLKNFMMFGLGFRSMYFLIKKLRTVFMEEFKYLAQGFPEVNAVMSEFMTSLNQLKGSLVTAFQPIASVILPVLTSFINKLSQAMNAIGKFFATLTGQGYIYEFTSDNIDCAESMKGTADAAKKAQKSLMGFDEINRLDDNSDSGGGGADGGAQGSWNKTDISDATSSLAELIKKCWEQEDFTELGVFLGEKLKLGLDMATAALEGKILTMGTKIAKAIATTINGFVSVDGLASSLGGTVGAAINTAMSIIDTFLTTTNWLDVGQFIADTINGFITKTDFGLIGKTVGDLVVAAINTFWATVTNINFTDIGSKISEAINNAFAALGAVDATGMSGWQKLGQGLSTTITGILEMMITALQGINWQEVGTAIGEFLGSIDWGQITWDLVSLVASFVSGLCQAFYAWADTDPLSAAIASLIGLAVVGIKVIPEILTVAPKLIGFFGKLGEVVSLVAGGAGTLHEALVAVFGGIGTTIAGVVSVIAGVALAVTNFFSMLKDGFSWVKEILMVIGIALAAVGAVILGVPAAIAAVVAAVVAVVLTAIVLIKEHWEEIKQFFINLWNGIKDFFINIWNGIKQFFINLWNGLRYGVTNIWNGLRDFFVNLWTGIRDFFVNLLTGIRDFFVNLWNGLKDAVSNILNGIRDFFVNIWNGIKDFFINLWDNLKASVEERINLVKNIIENVINKVKEIWENIWNGIKNFFTNLWDNIKASVEERINLVRNIIENVTNKVKEIWENIWNGIKNFFTDLWDKLKSSVQERINLIRDIIKNVTDKVKEIWEKVWNGIKDFVTNLWNKIKESISNVINKIKDTISNVINKIKDTISNVINKIKDTISNVINKIKETWTKIWDAVKQKVSDIWNGIKNTVSNAINSVKNTISNIINSIKTVWNNVWDSLKSKVTAIWDGIKNVIKNAINGIIGFINKMLAAIPNGINAVVNALNKLKIKIPDWVPGFGGSTFGFNLPTVTAPQIPYLAQGAVIPPNKEFMAVLGDQKHGTNIEAPLSTIQEAVATVMDDQVDALMAGFEAVIKAINDKDLLVAIGDKDIGMAANRFNRRQSIMKGGAY